MSENVTPVRLAVVGGMRGRYARRVMERFPDKACLAAICDRNEDVLSKWHEDSPEIETFSRYEDLLDWGAFDAVFIATPYPLHARQSLLALRAGKHVLSEVVAAATLDECWELVETVEKTGLTYMMGENYCYGRSRMMILNMVEQGVFGDLTYAEGAYIHDTRNLAVSRDGSLTWRGELHRDYDRNRYPTHSLGPISQWLKIGKDGGDRYVSTVTLTTGAFGMQHWVRDEFGNDHPGARPGFFKQGDTAVTLIRTEKGALVVIRVDSASARPHNMTHYALQGTKASYLDSRHHKEDPLIWIDGMSHGHSPPRDGRSAQWESLWNYGEIYEHPYWRKWMEVAKEAGHGGGDFFVLADFIDAVRNGTPPPIDVYDAVTWSAVVPLSQISVDPGGSAVEFPDFYRRKGAGTKQHVEGV